MATLTFDGVNDIVNINPLSTSLNNIPNGACTIAALCRVPNTTSPYEPWGLRENSGGGDSYHGMEFSDGSANFFADDDGMVFVQWTGGPAVRPTGAGGGNFFIVAVSWAAGTVTERVHTSAAMSAAESWNHQNSAGNNGGNRAGPGTGGGFFHIGWYRIGFFLGDIALIGVWAGTNMNDTQIEELWVNKRTSDWCDHSVGTPDTLIELTSTSLTDIGADPVSSIVVSGATAAGADPTGWTFDGCGAVGPQNQLAWIRA